MKKNILFSILGNLFFVLPILSQPAFKTVIAGYQDPSNNSFQIYYDLYSEHYIILGAGFGNISMGPAYLEVDTFGTYGGRKDYFLANAPTTNNSFILTSENQYVCAFSEYQGNNFKRMISKIDSSGTIIWKKVYDILTIGTHYMVHETNNKGFALSGGFWDGTIGHPFYMLVDSNGNVLNNRMFDSLIGNVIFTSQLSNGDVIAGINNDFNDGAIISKLDSSGNVLWSKNYFSHGIFLTMVKNSDESLTICGLVRSIAPVDPQIFVMKIDTGGNLKWAKGFGDGNVNLAYSGEMLRIRATQDGGYILAGTAGVYSTGRLRDVVLLKIDSTGTLQWSRCHGGLNTYDYGMDVSQTPDGGYIVLGNTSASYPSIGYYIFKTDSLGFAGCQEYSDSISYGNYSVHDSSIVLTAVPQNIVVTGSNLRDTLLAPPLTYDGCLLNPVRDKFHIDKTQNVFPNPTTGKVNIQSSEPFKKGNTITVYDSMGKVILQKNYANEKDGQLDLSRYGKGIYLVRITEGEKVRESKVVVE